MYDLVDVFHIVIGPSDIGGSFSQPEDHESERILSRLDDPLRKVRIVGSGCWKSKDDMTKLAAQDLDVDVIIQLDADEFWPRETFEAAIAAIAAGSDRVSAPHHIFWGDCQHVCERVDEASATTIYFAPTRTFRKFDNATLKHFQSVFVSHKTSLPIGLSIAALGVSTPIWHFGWIGRERVNRKFRFYSGGRDLSMPAPEEFASWLSGRGPAEFRLGPNRVRPVPYQGPPIPAQVADFVCRQARF
jgi:hypothetical protein